METAFLLFKKHGFNRVTIEEICRTSGVSKVTFYKYYKGKDGIVLDLVSRLFEDLMQRIEQILHSDKHIKDKMDKVSLVKQNMMSELGDELLRSIMQYPSTQKYLNDLTIRSWEVFRSLLIDEQNRGVLNPNINIDFILVFLQEVNRLFGENRLAGLFSSTEEMIKQINELLMYGIIARGE